MIHGVTGPNEYDNNVNNNWYTNYLAKWCLEYAAENISKLEKLGRGEYFKPLNPIYIISCEKGRE